MAEKEERIWLEFDIPKPKGAISATRCTTMTRTEAIEKMGKKMYRAVWGNMRYNKFDKDRFEKLAEAALNALLSGVK